MIPYWVFESWKISRSFGAVTDSVCRSMKLIIVTQNSMPRIHHRIWRWSGGMSLHDAPQVVMESPLPAMKSLFLSPTQ